jgi:pyruvate/2-oxoglutarate dehydrogenase complex dihydrolipoamide acyltransferase (E2) component
MEERVSSEITIPDLGATHGDGTLREWLVRPGDRVEAGQPLFVVSVGTTTVEVESRRAGVLREVWVQAGDTVARGSVVRLRLGGRDAIGGRRDSWTVR